MRICLTSLLLVVLGCSGTERRPDGGEGILRVGATAPVDRWIRVQHQAADLLAEWRGARLTGRHNVATPGHQHRGEARQQAGLARTVWALEGDEHAGG